MRCSEPGGSVAVAIIASRAPGRRAWVVRRMSIALEKNEDCVAPREEDIAAFEREHHIVLPSDYRAFLLSSPGGSPGVCDLSSFGTSGDVVGYIYGIHKGADWKRLSYAIAQFGHNLSAFLPVAVSAGGNYFLLRLGEPDRGAVYFWDHELEDFRPPTFESLIRVSDSFPLWLNSLREP